MPNRVNRLSRAEVQRAFEGVDSAILVDLTGVDSEATYALRKMMNEREINLRVVKNSTAKLALNDVGYELDDSVFDGPLAIAWNGDPAQVAKSFADFRREHKGTPLKIKGGFLEKKPITVQQVENLAALPGREQLLSMVVGGIAAPISAFIGVQAAVLRSVLYAFNAIKDKKDEAA